MGLKRLLMCMAGVVLASCGGGSGDPDGPAVDGGVVKGPVSGATVCVYRLVAGTKGEQLSVSAVPGAAGIVAGGCYVTPADGSYNFRLPRGTSGDLLIEATGGTFCSNEEVLAGGACPGGGTPVDLGASVMTSVASVQSNAGATVYTTPLTTAAVNRARGNGITSAAFATEFTTLAGQILGPSSGATPAQRPTAASQAYLQEVADFMKNGGTLAEATQSLEEGKTTSGGGGGSGGTTPATISSALVGTYELVFRVGGGAGCDGAGCTYADGEAVTVVVHGDGRLELPGGKILTNPYHRNFGGAPHLPEIIWYDADAKIEYALSDNEGGHFNEINLGDMNRPQQPGYGAFLGQLRKPSNNSLAIVQELAGTYAIGYQYGGAAVPWTSLTIGQDGSLTFEGASSLNVAAADVVEVTDRKGCCGRIDIAINRDLNSPADGITGQDKFSLSLDSEQKLRSIEYDPGSGNSVDDNVGVRLGTVQPLEPQATDIPSSNVIAGTLGGTALEVEISFTSGSKAGFTLTAEAAGQGGPQPQWSLQVFPGTDLEEGQTYHCVRTPTSNVFIIARKTAGAASLSTRNGGRCTITLTKWQVSGYTVTAAEGRFAADLLDFRQDVAPQTVVNGVFRYAAPAQ